MLIAHHAGQLREHMGGVLIPTMGALHAGHAALIRRGVAEAGARGLSAGCVVWVFINPTQFNNPADLQRYPRTLEADARVCAAAGASALYAPSAQEVYPPDQPVPIPPLPQVATRPGLEDAFRPGHFAGVCQVVARMFHLTRPVASVFGEKDWQQLAVIMAMVREQHLNVQIIPEPTVREPDGLAMSSRNVFLSPEDRGRALALFRALNAAREHGETDAAEARMRAMLAQEGITPQYAVVRHADTLLPLVDRSQPARALIAAAVGSVRLIDNAPWAPRS